MASPFEKLLNKALQKSSREDNRLLKEATKIVKKGYPETEIIDILQRFEHGLIDPKERAIVTDTLEELIGDEEDE